jgi:hypothetical protein
MLAAPELLGPRLVARYLLQRSMPPKIAAAVAGMTNDRLPAKEEYTGNGCSHTKPVRAKPCVYRRQVEIGLFQAADQHLPGVIKPLQLLIAVHAQPALQQFAQGKATGNLTGILTANPVCHRQQNIVGSRQADQQKTVLISAPRAPAVSGSGDLRTGRCLGRCGSRCAFASYPFEQPIFSLAAVIALPGARNALLHSVLRWIVAGRLGNCSKQ